MVTRRPAKLDLTNTGVRRRLVALTCTALAVNGAGCSLGGGKRPVASGDTGGSEDYTVVQPDLSACAAAPDARRYSHGAFFYVEEPVTLTDAAGTFSIERGFVLYGGISPSGSVYDDLWVYDLTNAGASIYTPTAISAGTVAEYCPWHSITSDASSTAGVYSGTLTFDPDTQEVALIGGFTRDASADFAGSSIYTLDLHDLGSGFAASADLGDASFDFAEVGEPLCQDPAPVVCFDISAGDCSVVATDTTVDACANDLGAGWPETCSDAEGEYGGTVGPYAGCAGDPYCVSGGSTTTTYSVEQDGIAEACAIWNPMARDIESHGGTTGCAGDCSGWDDLFSADLIGTESLHSANISGVLSYDGGSGTTWTEPDASEYYPLPSEGRPEWPVGASWGFRQAGCATVGSDFDLSERDWSADASFATLIVGGTRHQDAVPYKQYVLECGDSYCGQCLDYSSGYEAGENPYAAEDDGTMGPGHSVTRYDGVAYTALSLSPALDGLRGASVAPMGGQKVIVVGGIDYATGSAQPSVDVVDAGDGSVEYIADIGARDGAVSVFDPVAGVAYIFGGSDSDSSVYAVTGPESVSANQGPLLTPGAADVEMSWDATASEWSDSVSYTLVHTCSGSGCFSDQIDVTYVTDIVSEITGADVQVTYSLTSGAEWSGSVGPMLALSRDVDGGTSTARYRLPKIMANGDAVTLTVTQSARTATRYTDSEGFYSFQKAIESTNGLAAFEIGSTDPNEGYGMFALPAWPAFDPSNPEGSLDQVIQVDTRILPPAGFRPVAPGDPSDEGDATNFTGFTGVTPLEYAAYAIEDLQAPVSTTTAGGSVVYCYSDGGLTTAATAVDSYVATALPEQIAFIESRLGPFPVPTEHVMFLRPTSHAYHDLGRSKAGSLFVDDFSPDGTPSLEDNSDFTATALHELGHVWFGTMRGFTHESNWLIEGMPELLTAIHDPTNVAIQGVLSRGVFDVLGTQLNGGSTDLEDVSADDAEKFAAYYEIAPYTLAQFHAVLLGLGYSDEDIWAAWRSFLESGAFLQPIELSDVQAFFASLGRSAFYTQWVQEARVGTPLLALTDFQWDAASGTGAYTVAQVQGEFGFPDVSEVAFYLGCYPSSDPSGVSFDQCSVSGWNTYGQPVVMTSPTWNDMLTASVDDPTPAVVGLVANQGLLPEWVPTYATASDPAVSGALAWSTYCSGAAADSGDTAGPILQLCPDDVDIDGDGFGSFSDCDDGNASVYPGAPELYPASGQDLNCDGWWP